MAREVQQQLTLADDPALQGDLFGGTPEPTVLAPESASASESDGDAPDDQALLADASARPRPRRQRPAATATGTEGDGEQAGDPGGGDASGAPTPPGDADPEPDGDLPRWHHHSLVDPEALTPVLRHYVELKAAHPDRVLLYRLGDFYEFFFEDAILLSRLLELTLTGKDAGKALGRVPMAGIPHHAAERYCADLVRRGLSVALCDQLEATPAKGALLRRGITRVLTPGTVLEEGMLAARRNNWLCAVVLDGDGSAAGRWGLAVADVSTGEFRVTERTGSGSLHQELLQLEPAEVVWPGPAEAPAWCPEGLRLTPWPAPPSTPPKPTPCCAAASAWPASMAWGWGRRPWRCGPPGACWPTWTPPRPNLRPSRWRCPGSGTPATSWCSTPRPAATWSSPAPSWAAPCRAPCSGPSTAPPPPWGAAACAAGSRPPGGSRRDPGAAGGGE